MINTKCCGVRWVKDNRYGWVCDKCGKPFDYSELRGKKLGRMEGFDIVETDELNCMTTQGNPVIMGKPAIHGEQLEKELVDSLF